LIEVLIDGVRCEFEPGLTILASLGRRAIAVPALCHDDRLAPSGGCRMCSVNVRGHAQPVTACNTRLEAGMVIETHGAALEHERRVLLTLQAARYPAEALREAPDKPFHRALREYGVESACGGTRDPSKVDDSHPYIHVDMSQCIDCYRCVRICDEVQGQSAWKIVRRGIATEVRPAGGGTLLESPCVGCGACVDTCPTGALEDKQRLDLGTPERFTRTTCPYCGVGCELDVGTKGGAIVQILPVAASPVSKGHLCVKGRYAFEFVSAAERVTAPMIREDGAWRRVSWERAIEFAAAGLGGAIKRHGSQSVGVLGSARATNEENYLTQKFARVVLGTHNVDCCARVCHAPSAVALETMLGAGAATGSYDDIELAGTLLVVGANPLESHPVLGARLRRRALSGGALIVIDPRVTELAAIADLHLAPRPGTNIPLLNALANVIVTEGPVDAAFLDARVADWVEYRDFIAEWTPERAAAICGVTPERIRAAARTIANGKPVYCCHGLGVTEHVQGSEGVMTLVNLALLTGNLGRPGAGINPLRGQNNVQGAAHMGCEPSHLAGSIALEAGRALTERVWGVRLPRHHGLGLLEMIDAAGRGEFHALWDIGYDILLTNPDANVTRASLAKIDFVIVQDLFMTETAREFGTVFLPAASSFEKDGTFMNAERRVSRVRRAILPVGESRADWEILCLMARAMGHGRHFAFDSPEAVWEEIRSVWPKGSGIRYPRLEHGGIQWPCPAVNHPGTTTLHRDTFALGPRAALRVIDYAPSREAPSGEFPFLLVTGRTLYQFNAGTMTGHTKNALLRPADVLDLSLLDAERLGIAAGDRVRIRSRHGEADLPARLSAAMKPGEVFATFHSAETFLNRVTGPGRDAYSRTPEYKVTAVALERVPVGRLAEGSRAKMPADVGPRGQS
jgi:formate dehydrogenase major subunit